MNLRVTWPGLAALGLLAGCGDSAGGGGGEGTGGSGQAPEAIVIERFASFQQEGFTRVSAEGAMTQHGNAELVHIWVTDDAVAAYKAIDPDDDAATAEPFAEGTMIVKQHLDAAGEPTGSATVMAKQSEGFNPDAGDWFWARFAEDGALAQGGVVSFCIDCHEGNGLEATDWVNGVPASNQQ